MVLIDIYTTKANSMCASRVVEKRALALFVNDYISIAVNQEGVEKSVDCKTYATILFDRTIRTKMSSTVSDPFAIEIVRQ